MSNEIDTVKNLQCYLDKSEALTQAIENCNNINKNKYKLDFCIAVAENSNLRNCSKESLLKCCLQSLQYELPIDGRNYCYIIPYGTQAQLRVSYYGLLTLAKRNPDIEDIDCFEIYKGDVFTKTKTPDGDTYTLQQEFKEHNDEDLIGVAVYIKKKQAPSRIHLMLKKDIDKARSCQRTLAVWSKWYMEMAKKTAIRRALKVEAYENISKVFAYEDKEEFVDNNAESAQERFKAKAMAKYSQNKAENDENKNSENKTIQEAEKVDSKTKYESLKERIFTIKNDQEKLDKAREYCSSCEDLTEEEKKDLTCLIDECLNQIAVKSFNG